MMGKTVIDIVFIVIIAIFTLRCAVRGFISELMSMAALVFGLLAAMFFFRRGGIFVRERFLPDTETLSDIIAFAALFLIVFIVIKILEKMMKDIIKGIHLGGVDSFLGFFFGLAEGIIIVCLLLFLICIQPVADPASILEDSFFAELLVPFIFGNKAGITEIFVRLREVTTGGFIIV